MTKETRAELFFKALKRLGLEGSVQEISDNTGYDKGNVSKILNRKINPSKNFIQLFEDFYNVKIEDYNLDNNEVVNEVNESSNAIYVEYGTFMLVPLVTHKAQAGFLSGWGDCEYIDELPKEAFEVDKEYKGKYVCFEVSGDSMDDGTYESLLEGDIILCREIQKHHWKNKLHINSWDFVVVHRDQGILVKRITEHDTESGKLVLKSLNEYYEDQEVYMDDLIAIFNVVDQKRKRRR